MTENALHEVEFIPTPMNRPVRVARYPAITQRRQLIIPFLCFTLWYGFALKRNVCRVVCIEKR